MADPLSFGISIALNVGLSLLSAALAPKRNIEQGRIEDRAIQTSTYGRVISRTYGTIRKSGNIHWGLPKIPRRRKTRQGKGGLFGGGTVTTYTYFGSYGVAVDQRPVAGMPRIWLDKKLAFDSSGENGEERKEGLVFRLRDGAADQLADPVLSDHVGAANAPAYRGRSEVVFELLPLADHGNRVPNSEFELAMAAAAGDRIAVAMDVSEVGQVFTAQRTVIDRQRGVVYALTRDDLVETMVLTAHSLRTGALLASRPWLDVLNEIDPLNTSGWNSTVSSTEWVGILSGNEGDVLVARPEFTNRGPIGFIDKATLSGIGVIGVDDTAYVTTETAFTGFSEQVAVVPVTDSFGRVRTYVVGAGTNLGAPHNFWIVERQITGGIAYTFGADWSPGDSDVFVGIQAGPSRVGYRDVFLATREPTAPLRSDGKLTIWRLQLRNIPALGGAVEVGDDGVNITPEVIYSQTTGADGDGLVAMAYDEATGGLLVSNPGVGTGLLNIDTGAWTWFVDGADGQYPTADQVGTIVSDGTGWPTVSGTTLVLRDPATGTPTGEVFDWGDDFTNPVELLAAQTGPIWDPAARRAYFHGGLTQFTVAYGERSVATGETLRAVVEDICTLAGLEASDIDASALSGTVRGYTVNRQATAREMLTPLAAAFDFDAYEAGGKIVFRHLSATADWTVAEADLVRDDEGRVFKEAEGSAVGLPLLATVTYLDADNDYQPATQEARRISAPVDVTDARAAVDIDLSSMVLSHDEARAVVERALRRPWLERQTASFELPPEFLGVTEGDVLEVTAKGRTGLWRATRVTRTPRWTVAVEAVRTHPRVFDAAPAGISAPGVPGIENTVPGQNGTLFPFVFDVPLLRAEDNPGQGTGLIYAASAREVTARDNDWAANSLLVSQSGGDFADKAGFAAEAVWGVTETALADIPWLDYGRVQEVSLDVRVIEGIDQFQSVTQAQMIGQSRNGALLRNGAGQWEVIAFRDVALLGSGRVRLTGILRGARGTEVFATGHVAGAPLVLLNDDWVEAFTLLSSDLNKAAVAVAVAPRQEPETAPQRAVTWAINSLKPFRPAHVTATSSGGAISIAFDRRTRAGNVRLDGIIDVPLAEASESYEVDIFDGATLIRTLTGTSSPVAYGSSEVTADWGSVPATLTLAVYQISAAVGRGLSQTITIEVT